MKDLYKTYAIPEFENDSEVIKSAISDLSTEDKQVCEYVLLNKQRKQLYDTACSNLRFIGAIRAELSLKNTEHWNIDRYRDFVPLNQSVNADVKSMRFDFLCIRKALFFILTAALVLGCSYAYTHYSEQENIHKLQSDKNIMHVAIAGLNLRSRPEIDSNVLLVLSRNQNVYIINSVSDSNWKYVKTDNNVTGYVNSYYLKDDKAKLID